MITTIDPKLLRAIASVLAHPFAYPLKEIQTILRPVALDVTFDAFESLFGAYVPDHAKADDITTATLCAVMNYTKARQPSHVGQDDIAAAILSAEGPLLTWWCTELAKHLPSPVEEPAP